MFYDNDGRTAVNQTLKYHKKRLYIQRMQADGRLIEDKDRV